MALEISAFGASDVGRKRRHNEDSYLIDDPLGLYAVADGMGGHAAGDVASSLAMEVVQDFVARHAEVLRRLSDGASPEARSDAQAVLEQAIQAASAEIHRVSQAELTKRGMGTTFVCMARAGDRAVIGHVGDSRIYLLRAGKLHRLTEDHTLVAAHIKAGTMTREEAAVAPFSNVVTRAVGNQSSVQVDTLLLDLMPGDLFLLCSDGLHSYLRDEEVPQMLAVAAPPELPARLIHLANERGGKDNITAVVVQVRGDMGAADGAVRIDALRKIPLFRHLTYKEQTALLGLANTCNYPPGALIVREGEPGQELYVVLRGRVSVVAAGVPIAELGPGGHFGEMGLVENLQRSATVRASEATVVMTMARTDVMNLMRRDSVLAVKLLWSFVNVLSQRLRLTNTELSELKASLEREAADALPFVSR